MGGSGPGFMWGLVFQAPVPTLPLRPPYDKVREGAAAFLPQPLEPRPKELSRQLPGVSAKLCIVWLFIHRGVLSIASSVSLWSPERRNPAENAQGQR